MAMSYFSFSFQQSLSLSLSVPRKKVTRTVECRTMLFRVNSVFYSNEKTYIAERFADT